MAMTLKIAGASLPTENLTQIALNNEIIWSSNTGRTTSGLMMGDIIANKATLSLEFQWISVTNFNTILNAVNSSPFFTVQVKLDNITLADITAYRSTVERTMGGKYGGEWYLQGAKFQLIEQ